MTKKVIVTGASRGLGLAIAQRLLTDGYSVIGFNRSETDGFSNLMNQFPGKASFQKFDLCDTAAIADIARQVVKNDGPIYGLVNNAGIGMDGILATMHHTDIEKLVRTNLIGPITLTKYVLRSMISHGEGRIVNISSIIGSTGFHGLSVYAATKGGLDSFTRSLAREAGKRNVTVNCVAPGFLETDMTANFQGPMLESVRRRAPLGFPHLAEVAGAVSYLLHPDARSVTGTIMTVDGGSTA